MNKNKADREHDELVWGRSCSSFPSEHQSQQQLSPVQGDPLVTTCTWRRVPNQTHLWCNSQLQTAQTWIFMTCPVWAKNEGKNEPVLSSAR